MSASETSFFQPIVVMSYERLLVKIYTILRFSSHSTFRNPILAPIIHTVNKTNPAEQRPFGGNQCPEIFAAVPTVVSAV